MNIGSSVFLGVLLFLFSFTAYADPNNERPIDEQIEGGSQGDLILRERLYEIRIAIQTINVMSDLHEITYEQRHKAVRRHLDEAAKFVGRNVTEENVRAFEGIVEHEMAMSAQKLEKIQNKIDDWSKFIIKILIVGFILSLMGLVIILIARARSKQESSVS